MRPIVFTTILLLVLGTAWTLYLEYGNRQFRAELPSPLSLSAPSEEVSLQSLPSFSVEISSIENDPDSQGQWQNLQGLPPVEGMHLEIGPSTEEPPVKELTLDELMKLLEASPSAPPSQTVPPEAAQDAEESQKLTREQFERRARARATFQQIFNRPPDREIPIGELGDDILNKLSGPPIGPGRLYFHTPQEHEEVLKAIDAFNAEE